MKKTNIVSLAVLTGALSAGLAWANCGACGPATTTAAGGACAVGGACGSCTAPKDAAPACATCATAEGGACDHCKAPATAAHPAEIDTPALKALLASGSAVTVLDARTGKYDDGRRLPGATALSPAATAEEAATRIANKHALVVTYCAGVKCPASVLLATQLRKLGYENVLEYKPGIAGWVEAGGAVETAKN